MMKTYALTMLLGAVIASPTWAHGGGGDVFVHGYYRASGTYVPPYYQSSHDGNFQNNFSTAGNVNPYTGQEGTRYFPSPSYGPLPVFAPGPYPSYGPVYVPRPYKRPVPSGSVVPLPEKQASMITSDFAYRIPFFDNSTGFFNRYDLLNNSDYWVTEITYRVSYYLNGKLTSSHISSAAINVEAGDWQLFTLICPNPPTNDVNLTILSAKGIPAKQ